MDAAVSMTGPSDTGIVVIGRNEGARLIRCLDSLAGAGRIVYVDSGSTDGSVAAARARGADVVALDMTRPFTAARARNEGAARLDPAIAFIQFVDGDCAVQPGWMATARAALDADPGLAAVFGRRREIHPEASRYNWLCDREWSVPPGPVRFCGGDVLIRRAPLDAAGGYPGEMIAGEEPDLSIRMRARGWRIACLPAEMTLHDAAITRFGQWWKRAVRSGHAYAELAARNPDSPLHDYDRRGRSVLLWGAALPGVIVIALLAAILLRAPALAALAGVVALLPLAQIARLALRERRTGLSWRDAATVALFLMLAKPAQAQGMARFHRARLSGRRTHLIEYKA